MIVIDCDRKAQWNEGMVYAVLHVITEIFHNHSLATSQKMVTVELDDYSDKRSRVDIFLTSQSPSIPLEFLVFS